ncbi:hypothetical protein [Harenicola maris]
MQTMTAGYDSLRLLLALNWARLMYGCTIAGSLVGGAYVGKLFF